jgi:3-oxoacyl-[acyl-carrier-protein] synthase III
VPKKLLTNADLEKIVNTSDEWITTRTGIKERHVISEGEKFSDLCTKAAEIALKRAHVKPEDLDMILVGTISGDMVFPATSCLVQRNLGATKAAASDVGAACVGFLYGLHLADGLIQSAKAENVLVIGGEILTRYVDWTDRATCVLFGDGAGAVVVEASNDGIGIRSTVLRGDGSKSELLTVRGGGSMHPPSSESVRAGLHHIRMNGNEVFKTAVPSMASAATEALAQAGLGLGDIDLFIPHQANARIIDAVARKLGLDASKVFTNIHKYGNTSAASIPIALCEAVDEGRVRAGDTLVFAAFGGGMTWGAAVVDWTAPVRPRSPGVVDRLRELVAR